MVIDGSAVLENPKEEISKLCDIDLDDITRCLKEHAVLYGRAYSFYEACKAKQSEAKWLYEKEKTKVFSLLREEGMAIGAAKEASEVDPEVIVLYENYLKSEKRTGVFHALIRGLEHRKDMLVQLSSREKKEYGAF